MLLRNVGPATYHGTGKRWLVGEEREVDETRGAWLLKFMPEQFVVVGPEVGPPAPSADEESGPSRRTKPASWKRK